MAVMTDYEPGTFCWVDVQTSDQEGAKSFYGELFGWTTEDMPIDEGASYAMCRIDGKDVCAIAPLPSEQAQMGVPPHWNSYVSVTSADEAAEKAKSLGGNLLMEPFDVMDAGRMAVVQDPTGAVFIVWETKNHAGAALVNEPGALIWNELATRDIEKAKGFYNGLFGWEGNTEAMPGAEIEYTQFMAGDKPRGGMMEMTEEWPAEAPPGWVVYFAVDDAEATVTKARSLGATIVVEPRDIPGVGTFAIITDPQGATFAIIKPNMGSAE